MEMKRDLDNLDNSNQLSQKFKFKVFYLMDKMIDFHHKSMIVESVLQVIQTFQLVGLMEQQWMQNSVVTNQILVFMQQFLIVPHFINNNNSIGQKLKIFHKFTFSTMDFLFNVTAQVLFIPFFQLFASTFRCEKNTNNQFSAAQSQNIYFNSVTKDECFSSIKIPNYFLSVFCLFLMYFFCDFINRMCFDSRLDCSYKNSKLNGKYEQNLQYFVTNIVIVSTFLFEDRYQVFKVIISIIWSFNLVKLLNQNMIYNFRLMSFFKQEQALIVFLTSSVGVYNYFFSGSSIVAFFWIVGIIFITIYNIYYEPITNEICSANSSNYSYIQDALQQLRILCFAIQKYDQYSLKVDGFLNRHRNDCNLPNCPSRSNSIRIKKFNRMLVNQTKNEDLIMSTFVVYTIFNNNILKFGGSNQMRLLYAFFLLDTIQNKDQALIQLQFLMINQPTLEEEFIAYRLKKIIMQLQNQKDYKKLDFTSELTTDEYSSKFKKLLHGTIQNFFHFWSELLEPSPQANNLLIKGSQILEQIEMIHDQYEHLSQNGNINQSAFHSYQVFFLNILEDKERYQNLQRSNAIQISKLDDNKQEEYIKEEDTYTQGSIVISSQEENFANIIEINQEMLKIIGFTKSQVLLKNISFLIPDIWQKHHNQFIDLFLATGQKKILVESRDLFIKSKQEYSLPIKLNIKTIPSNTQGLLFQAQIIVAQNLLYDYPAFIITNVNGQIENISPSVISMFNVDMKKVKQGMFIEKIIPNFWEYILDFQEKQGKELMIKTYQLKMMKETKVKVQVQQIKFLNLGSQGYIISIKLSKSDIKSFPTISRKKQNENTVTLKYPIHQNMQSFKDKLLVSEYQDDSLFDSQKENTMKNDYTFLQNNTNDQPSTTGSNVQKKFSQIEIFYDMRSNTFQGVQVSVLKQNNYDEPESDTYLKKQQKSIFSFASPKQKQQLPILNSQNEKSYNKQQLYPFIYSFERDNDERVRDILENNKNIKQKPHQVDNEVQNILENLIKMQQNKSNNKGKLSQKQQKKSKETDKNGEDILPSVYIKSYEVEKAQEQYFYEVSNSILNSEQVKEQADITNDQSQQKFQQDYSEGIKTYRLENNKLIDLKSINENEEQNSENSNQNIENNQQILQDESLEGEYQKELDEIIQSKKNIKSFMKDSNFNHNSSFFTCKKIFLLLFLLFEIVYISVALVLYQQQCNNTVIRFQMYNVTHLFYANTQHIIEGVFNMFAIDKGVYYNYDNLDYSTAEFYFQKYLESETMYQFGLDEILTKLYLNQVGVTQEMEDLFINNRNIKILIHFIHLQTSVYPNNLYQASQQVLAKVYHFKRVPIGLFDYHNNDIYINVENFSNQLLNQILQYKDFQEQEIFNYLNSIQTYSQDILYIGLFFILGQVILVLILYLRTLFCYYEITSMLTTIPLSQVRNQIKKYEQFLTSTLSQEEEENQSNEIQEQKNQDQKNASKNSNKHNQIDCNDIQEQNSPQNSEKDKNQNFKDQIQMKQQKNLSNAKNQENSNTEQVFSLRGITSQNVRPVKYSIFNMKLIIPFFFPFIFFSVFIIVDNNLTQSFTKLLQQFYQELTYSVKLEPEFLLLYNCLKSQTQANNYIGVRQVYEPIVYFKQNINSMYDLMDNFTYTHYNNYNILPTSYQQQFDQYFSNNKQICQQLYTKNPQYVNQTECNSVMNGQINEGMNINIDHLITTMITYAQSISAGNITLPYKHSPVNNDICAANSSNYSYVQEAIKQLRILCHAIAKYDQYSLKIDGFLNRHRNDCNLPNCPSRSNATRIKKFNRMLVNQTTNEDLIMSIFVIYTVFNNNILKFGGSNQIRLLYALFLLETIQNKDQSLIQLSFLLLNQPSLEEEFIAYRLNKLIMQMQNHKDYKKLDFSSELTLDEYSSKFKKTLSNTMQSFLQFWQELLEPSPQADNLLNKGNQLVEQIGALQNQFDNLTQQRSLNQSAFRCYQAFSLNILEDKEHFETLQKQTIDQNEQLGGDEEGNLKEEDTYTQGTIVISSQEENFSNIIEVNLELLKIIGFLKSQVLSKNISFLIPNIWQQYHNQFIDQYLATGQKKIIGQQRELFIKSRQDYSLPIKLNIKTIPSHTQGLLFQAQIVAQNLLYDYPSFIITNVNGQIENISPSVISMFNIDMKKVKQGMFIEKIIPCFWEFILDFQEKQGKELMIKTYQLKMMKETKVRIQVQQIRFLNLGSQGYIINIKISKSDIKSFPTISRKNQTENTVVFNQTFRKTTQQKDKVVISEYIDDSVLDSQKDNSFKIDNTYLQNNNNNSVCNQSSTVASNLQKKFSQTEIFYDMRTNTFQGVQIAVSKQNNYDEPESDTNLKRQQKSIFSFASPKQKKQSSTINYQSEKNFNKQSLYPFIYSCERSNEERVRDILDNSKNAKQKPHQVDNEVQNILENLIKMQQNKSNNKGKLSQKSQKKSKETDKNGENILPPVYIKFYEIERAQEEYFYQVDNQILNSEQAKEKISNDNEQSYQKLQKDYSEGIKTFRLENSKLIDLKLINENEEQNSESSNQNIENNQQIQQDESLEGEYQKELDEIILSKKNIKSFMKDSNFNYNSSFFACKKIFSFLFLVFEIVYISVSLVLYQQQCGDTITRFQMYNVTHLFYANTQHIIEGVFNMFAIDKGVYYNYDNLDYSTAEFYFQKYLEFLTMYQFGLDEILTKLYLNKVGITQEMEDLFINNRNIKILIHFIHLQTSVYPNNLYQASQQVLAKVYHFKRIPIGQFDYHNNDIYINVENFSNQLLNQIIQYKDFQEEEIFSYLNSISTYTQDILYIGLLFILGYVILVLVLYLKTLFCYYEVSSILTTIPHSQIRNQIKRYEQFLVNTLTHEEEENQSNEVDQKNQDQKNTLQDTNPHVKISNQDSQEPKSPQHSERVQNKNFQTQNTIKQQKNVNNVQNQENSNTDQVFSLRGITSQNVRPIKYSILNMKLVIPFFFSLIFFSVFMIIDTSLTQNFTGLLKNFYQELTYSVKLEPEFMLLFNCLKSQTQANNYIGVRQVYEPVVYFRQNINSMYDLMDNFTYTHYNNYNILPIAYQQQFDLYFSKNTQICSHLYSKNPQYVNQTECNTVMNGQINEGMNININHLIAAMITYAQSIAQGNITLPYKHSVNKEIIFQSFSLNILEDKECFGVLQKQIHDQNDLKVKGEETKMKDEDTYTQGVILISSQEENFASILEVNLEMLKIIGFTKSQVLSKDISILIPNIWQQYHNQFIDQFLATGEKKIIAQQKQEKAEFQNETNNQIFKKNFGQDIKTMRLQINNIIDLNQIDESEDRNSQKSNQNIENNQEIQQLENQAGEYERELDEGVFNMFAIDKGVYYNHDNLDYSTAEFYFQQYLELETIYQFGLDEILTKLYLNKVGVTQEMEDLFRLSQQSLSSVSIGFSQSLSLQSTLFILLFLFKIVK
ncbi:hypothetical protein ABPG73_022748 [Tetrahymena malaccensis]